MSRKLRQRRGARTGASTVGAGDPIKILFRRGLTLQEQGKLPEAADIYRQVLESDPKYLHARNNLGNVLRDTGDTEGSIACYLAVIAIDPSYALAHYNLGNARRKEGKFEEAAACYLRMLDIRPDFASACNNLGVTLRDLGRDEEAIPWLYRAVAADPRYLQAHLNLGDALRDQGNLDEAAECYHQALKVDPRYIDARCNLGSLLRTQDRLEESMACYNTARKMDPKNVLIQFGIAETLRAQGKPEAALAAFQRATKLDPDNADIHNNMGNTLRALDRIDDAQACYRRAMELDPNHPDARMNFAIAQPFTPDDPNFDRLKGQLDQKGTTDERRLQITFALGRGCDDGGQYDDAMAYFIRGNALKKEQTTFSRQAYREMTKKIRDFFTAPRPLKNTDASSGQQTPVFMLGMSRSGKTLAESLLKHSPLVFGAGERYTLLNTLNNIRDEQSIAETFPDCAAQLDDAMVANLGARYMAAMGKLSNAPLVINTLPGIYLHLGLVFQAMPTARVIFCRRDPLDVCLRVYFKQYANENAHANSFADIAAYHDGYCTMMAHWQSLYSERILEIQYEDMVRDPRATAERLYTHLGLKVNKGVLEARFSTHEIGQWQNYKAHMGPLQAALAGLTV